MYLYEVIATHSCGVKVEQYQTCLAAHYAAHQMDQSNMFENVEVVAPIVDFQLSPQ